MKKLLVLAVMVATLGVCAAAESPIKLSLYDNIAWPQTNKANIVLGLVDNNTPTVAGVSLAIGSSRVDDLTGASWAWIYARSNNLTGVQWALYDVTNRATGVTFGLVNHNKGAFTGAQLGFVNLANNMKGLQWGFYNQAETLTGLQLGFVNYINRIDKGLQIGLVNIIESNGWLPIMVIVNGKF
ncbi:MAG: hypothetical protein J5594_00685 [Elusimicrobiaceae bacterium]|nr:hypothetical protein [Elusimicrobiaceae bacterium]